MKVKSASLQYLLLFNTRRVTAKHSCVTLFTLSCNASSVHYEFVCVRLNGGVHLTFQTQMQMCDRLFNSVTAIIEEWSNGFETVVDDQIMTISTPQLLSYCYSIKMNFYTPWVLYVWKAIRSIGSRSICVLPLIKSCIRYCFEFFVIFTSSLIAISTEKLTQLDVKFYQMWYIFDKNKRVKFDVFHHQKSFYIP